MTTQFKGMKRHQTRRMIRLIVRMVTITATISHIKTEFFSVNILKSSLDV